MKKIFALFFLLALLPAAYSQTADPAREAAEQLVRKYALDSKQADKAHTIQVRKQRNLAEIEALKTSDPVLYHAKMESIQKGTHASIRRMLTTPTQRELFQQTQSEQRRLRAEKRLAMEAQGASDLVIEAAVLAIYIE